MLPIEFLVRLLRCKKYPPSLSNDFALKLAEYSLEKLKPIIVDLQEKVNGPLSDEIKNLLNPEILEENIGEELRKNSRKFLNRKGKK